MLWTLALEPLAMTYVESVRQVVVLCRNEVSIHEVFLNFRVTNQHITILGGLCFLLFNVSESLNPEGAVAEGPQFGRQLIVCDVSPRQEDELFVDCLLAGKQMHLVELLSEVAKRLLLQLGVNVVPGLPYVADLQLLHHLQAQSSVMKVGHMASLHQVPVFWHVHNPQALCVVESNFLDKLHRLLCYDHLISLHL